MAEESESQTQQENQEANEQQEQEQSEGKSNAGMLPMIIMSTIVIVSLVVGFFLGKIFAGGPQTADADTVQQEENEPEDDLSALENENGEKSWFYPLEPISTNLGDSGSMRYIRASLNLEMLPSADKAKGEEFLKEKQPIIDNVLNIYFMGLTTEDTNSDKDMRRIQYELQEILNEALYGKSKPLIKAVLFKEFAVQ